MGLREFKGMVEWNNGGYLCTQDSRNAKAASH